MAYVVMAHGQVFGASSAATTLRETWEGQLSQIPGLSAAGASAIADAFPSMRRMLSAHAALATVAERELLLSDVAIGEKRRRLGAVLSKRVYQVCNSYDLYIHGL